MMNEENADKKIDNNNVLGPGYEPLAVCLMILFVWMFFVSFAGKYFF